MILFSNQIEIVGCWVGYLKVIGKEMPMKVCFEEDSLHNLVGKIDIPQQNAFNLKLNKVSFTTDSCSFELSVSPMNIAYFRGKIYCGGTDSVKISGTFSQMGIRGSFELEKYFEETDDEFNLTSLYEEEVEVKTGKVELGGTFSRPQEFKKYPVIVFITGSGQQNRDEEIYGFKVFRKISDFLVENGYATLRMDDRGVGSSTDLTGEVSSTLDYVDDVLYLVEYLKTRSDVDINKIGLLGHSEGAIVAYIVASKIKDIAFLISLAGSTIRGDSLILEQVKIAMREENVPDSIYYQTIALQNEVFEIVRNDGDFQKLRSILLRQAKRQLEAYPENIRTQIPEQLIQRNIQLQLENLKSKWFKTFISLDPMEFLPKLNCPVLFLFGGKDTQVPPSLMLTKLEKLVKGKKKLFTIKIFSDGNHLFQKAKSGSHSEYGILPKKFVPGFKQTIVDWLNKTLMD